MNEQEQIEEYNDMLKKARHLGYITQLENQTTTNVKSAAHRDNYLEGMYKLYADKDEKRIVKFAGLHEACSPAAHKAAA